MAVPLREWIHEQARRRRGGRDDESDAAGSGTGRDGDWLLDAVELAREVAEACSQCRDRSDDAVSDAPSLIRVENFVVVQSDQGAGRKCCAQFKANLAPQKYSVEAKEERTAVGDLERLGAVIYEILLGEPPTAAAVYQNGFASANSVTSNGGSQPQTKRDRKLPSGPSSASLALQLESACLPLSLCDLLLALLATSDTDSAYTSLREVAEDLDRMLRDPDHFLNSRSEGSFVGHLDIPSGKLYGRDQHLSMLLEAYDRTISSASSETAANPGGSASNQQGEIVLLSGYSGTGKSSLANMAKGVLLERGAYFISGKFDKMRQGQPLSAIVAAFDDFCSMLLLERPEEEVGRIRLAVQDAVGCDGRVLTDLIPSLTGLIGDPDMPTAILEGRNSRNRLRFIFRKFVQAVSGCDAQHPIVLFLDDLQWADEESLQLIHFLATDRATNGSFLFLGAYRDNEVDSDHPLKATLKAIQTAGVGTTEIAVGEVDLDSTMEFVSDALRSFPRRRTQLLAEEVHRKTGGNALFLRQFLHSLVDDGLLRYSLPSRRWEWDMESIRSKSIADNVVQLMMSKMLKLSSDVQYGLKVASCFGNQCAESILELLGEMSGGRDEGDGSSGHGVNVIRSLDIASSEGLTVRCTRSDTVGAFYRFSHDQIQLAAYSLIPAEERAGLHLTIGRRLCGRTWFPELADGLALVAVDQLNRGSALITDRGERASLARLNLRAGRKQVALSAFLPASMSFAQGIRLLDDAAWEDQYDLCLELHSSCVEAHNVLGNHVLVQSMAASIFERGKQFEDQMRAYCALISSLGSQRNFNEALLKGFNVLAALGETFPDDIDEEVLREDLDKTRCELEAFTFKSILNLDEIVNETKKAAMQVLDLLLMQAYVSRQEVFALATFRMVRLSLAYGLCDVSSTAFAALGVLMCRKAGDPESGYRFGKLAVALLERLNAPRCLSRVYTTVYGFINIFFEPLQACKEKYTEGFEIGMAMGDVESAMNNAMQSILMGVQNGSNLQSLAVQGKNALLTMKEYQQHLHATITAPWVQAILNLVGLSDDPAVLSGAVMDQQRFLQMSIQKGVVTAEIVVYYLQMWLAFLFRRYDLAVEMARLRQSRTATGAGQRLRSSTLVSEVFYTALIGAVMSRICEKNAKDWRPIILDAIKKLECWVENSSWNFQHKLELLSAELAFLDGDVEAAAKGFDKSICSAKEHKFIHEQALACERAAMFSLELGNNITAKEYLSESHRLYLEWGSKCKADDVLKQMKDLGPPE